MSTEHTETTPCDSTSRICCCCCVKAVETLIRAEVDTLTIGRQARVRFGVDTVANAFYCVPSGGNGQQHTITRQQIAAVCARYAFLKELDGKEPINNPRHLSAGQYNQPTWNAPGSNGMIVCPFIAALVELLDGLSVI